MIRIHRRSADFEDIKAVTRDKGSLVRNIVTLTLPAGIVMFVGAWLVFRSYVPGLVIAGLFVLGSAWSNVRFFKAVGERGKPGSGRSMVEVLEVEAARVYDIEHLGSHGPAYCFFSDDGQALLLVGQWLLEAPRFPSLSFRVLRWTDDGRPIRIEVTGDEVEPEPSTVALRGNYSNGDIEVFRAGPQTLQQDLEETFGKRAA